MSILDYRFLHVRSVSALSVYPLQRQHVLAATAEARRLDGVRPRRAIPLLRHRPDFYSVGNGFIVSRHKH